MVEKVVVEMVVWLKKKVVWWWWCCFCCCWNRGGDGGENGGGNGGENVERMAGQGKQGSCIYCGSLAVVGKKKEENKMKEREKKSGVYTYIRKS